MYKELTNSTKGFKAQSIDTAEVINRVLKPFDRYKDLIVGFNTVSPPAYHTEVVENKTTEVLNTAFIGPEEFRVLHAVCTVVMNTERP